MKTSFVRSFDSRNNKLTFLTVVNSVETNEYKTLNHYTSCNHLVFSQDNLVLSTGLIM